MTKKLEEKSKYSKWYYELVFSRQNRLQLKTEYYEKHHILPKSLGGNNNKENLVFLTAREHYLAHLLLVKMTTGNAKSKMAFALRCMTNFKNQYHNRYMPPSKIYEIAKRHAVEATRIINTGHPNYLLSHKEESKIKISKTMSKNLSKLTKEELSDRIKNSCSSPESWTDERRSKISNALKNKPKSKNAIKNMKKSNKKFKDSLTTSQKKEIYGLKNKGKTWKLINGKRVWLEKENSK
jgi:hypothetical protein